MTPLRIGHGNGHNRQSLVDYAAKVRWDSFSGNESQDLVRELRQLGRVTVASRAAADRRIRATTITTSFDREWLGELSLRVSEALPGKINKFAPDRALVASYYAHPLAEQMDFAGIAHFALHPDATVMHRQPEHPLVREYREALESTRWHMAAARRDGYLRVLTGDLQASARFRAPYGPRELLLEPLGMTARVAHIDWIMIDPELRFDGPLRRHELFDHTGFTATLTAR